METNKTTLFTKTDAELVSDNQIDLYRLFGIEEDKDCYILKTGTDTPLLNLIILTQAVEATRINELNKIYLDEKINFGWWIDESKVTNNFLTNFQNDQYSLLVNVPGMVFDIDRYEPTEYNKPADIRIIDTLNDFKEWLDVVGQVFSRLDQSSINLFMSKLSPLLGSNIFIPIGAYIDGKLVATASIYIENSVGGFNYDATLEEYRGKGINSSLYKFRFDLLKKMGVKKAIVLNSPISSSLSKKAGFKPVANYKLFVYNY
jgi:GNAT superfamily N-acetyltransferase